ncbi:putative transglycosylase [Xanthomonas phage FoX6]|uniref:Putative transglycosylase n=1 Tax=Xanthomonas phage FoX6 TaxID=2723902 RepID=A0A858NQA6_9CAUD|nr:putative transglycosylase [Xanthomonas phage FoX6]
MSDELDKFVMEYAVETDKALKRLEELRKKMDGVEVKSKGARKGVQEFASGAAEEVGRLIPGVNAARTAVAALGAEFAIAGVAVLGVGAAIKSVIDLRNQYESQRIVGQETGVGSLRIENWRRQLRKASGGRVNEEQGNDTIKRLSELRNAAFQDPTGIASVEAKRLRMLGVNPGNRTTGPTSTKDFVTNLATSLKGLSEGQVQGVAKDLGLSQDALVAMSKLGSEMGRITELTDDEANKRLAAEETLKTFNDSMSELNEKFREASNELAQKVLPKLTEFINQLLYMVDRLPTWNKDMVKSPKAAAGNQATSLVGDLMSPVKMLEAAQGKRDVSTGTSFLMGLVKGAFGLGDKSKKAADVSKAAADKTEEAAKVVSKSASENADAQDKTNEEGLGTANKMGLAINMFSGAVATFANAIDERQAWAAWAGEIGRAAGLGSDPAEDKSRRMVETNTGVDQAQFESTVVTKFDKYFKQASEKYNLPVDLLKAHAKVESNFDPKATSSVGAQGIMQVMPANFKALGIKNGYDPEQNIMGAAKLIRENLDRYQDLSTSIKAYHAGPNRAGWGPKTADYLVKVMGQYQKYNKEAAQSVGKTATNSAGVLARSMASDKPVAPTTRQPLDNPATRPNQPLDNPATRPNQPVPTNRTAPAREAPYREPLGESRDKMGLKAVQQNIAQRLGVPVQQLQQGAINKGDVEFASDQIQRGIQNGIKQMQTESMGAILPPSQRAKLLNEIKQQQIGLNSMRNFSAEVVNNSQSGGRSITLGERSIVINVEGVANPEATAEAVSGKLTENINDILNGHADGLSY